MSQEETIFISDLAVGNKLTAENVEIENLDVFTLNSNGFITGEKVVCGELRTAETSISLGFESLSRNYGIAIGAGSDTGFNSNLSNNVVINANNGDTLTSTDNDQIRIKAGSTEFIADQNIIQINGGVGIPSLQVDTNGLTVNGNPVSTMTASGISSDKVSDKVSDKKVAALFDQVEALQALVSSQAAQIASLEFQVAALQ